ncbi:MAG TPA: cytidine deaminase [Beijerinckiaceae bacterium]|nr:cytidine deaminase [Beijerinckiaceae bacterium]
MNSGESNSLLEAARHAQLKAYAPYSELKVGAAIRARSGNIYVGCNVENAAFPVGTCAEAAAVAAMILAGDHRIAEVVVVGEGRATLAPCGACRQVLSEFSDADTRVHIADRAGIHAVLTLNELLPHSFGRTDLPASATRIKK